MATHRMAAVDAQFYWMSAKTPNDQFLLYAFAGEPTSFGRAVDDLRCRARACPDLAMRVADGNYLSYPNWVPATVEPADIVAHDLADDSWPGCLDAVVQLAEQQLDLRRMPWRLHLFAGVGGIPGGTGPGTVAVLQIGHALADGTRAAALAGWLFGRAAPVSAVAAPAPGCLLWRAAHAARADRSRTSDIRAGRLAPPPESRPLVASNSRPAGARAVRTLVRRRCQLRGSTVTVGVLTAVSTALSEHLGGQCDSLVVEVPMAKPGPRQAHNHFANVTVGLYPQLAPGDRARRIAADLADARRRAEHPAVRSADRAFAAVPAPLLRWGVTQFDPDARPSRVSGNTAVSSVYRGAADLHFGDAPVLLTAGYPALSPVMGLTHGVHGIGDTVAISVHAAESAVGDIDSYLQRLASAL